MQCYFLLVSYGIVSSPIFVHADCKYNKKNNGKAVLVELSGTENVIKYVTGWN